MINEISAKTSAKGDQLLNLKIAYQKREGESIAGEIYKHFMPDQLNINLSSSLKSIRTKFG